ncbi:MAG: rhombosortase [Steroidobacteraceae bacterium]
MNADNGFARFLRSLNCDGRYGLWLVAALALLLLPLTGGDAWRDAWQYQRSQIASGQWWRLATAHLVHLDARHALVNAAGLALLWALFARSYSARQWCLVLAAIATGIGAGLWWLQPQLQWYVGASGVLHGIFAAGCVALIRTQPTAGWVAAAVFAAKLLWEQWQGPLPFSGTAQVITAAHLYGAVGGALAGLLLARRLY